MDRMMRGLAAAESAARRGSRRPAASGTATRPLGDAENDGP